MNNASELLSLDYKIVFKDAVYNKHDIDNATEFYKAQLYNLFKGKTVGKTVYLWTNELFPIIGALKASWELGCTVFAADYNPYYSDMPEFKNFYKFIDVVIGHSKKHPNKSESVLVDVPHIFIEKFKRDTDYPKVEYTLDQPVDENTNAVTTHTSGTTGFPKLKYFTHKIVIDIADSEVIMNLMDESDKGGHVKTLHHGSLFLNYAIPLLSICTEHHCLHNMFQGLGMNPQACTKVLLEYVNTHDLTRLMIPYNWIRYMSDIDDIDLKNRVTLNSIVGPTDKEMADIFDRFHPKQVINMWGCTEVGSVFHSITDANNIGNYNPNKFDIINGEINCVVNADHILLKWKSSDEWHKVADQFRIFPDHLLWLGRTSTITINNQIININQIKELLETEFNTVHFSIVADYELNKLYLASWDDKMPDNIVQLNNVLAKTFGEDYKFDRVKRLNYGSVLQGMKPSQPILLYMFRTDEQAS